MISVRMSIGIRTATIVAVLLIVAFVYGMRSEAVGTTFATGSGQGGLDLKIDSKTIYNGVLQPKLSWALKNLRPACERFFRFFDVKPGDTGMNLISVHVAKNPAWVCLDFVNLKDKENGNNEPESHEDVNGVKGGELSSGLEFFSWMDDGDNIYEVGERALFGTSTQAATSTLRGMSYPIADSANGPAILVGQTKYVGISWCAGNLTVSTTTATITCDGATLGNGVQTDSMSVDVSFRAITSANNDAFVCVKPVEKKYKGNNGHGNDDDGNDDSNPGKSNDPNDNTDDDGKPGKSVGVSRNDNRHDDDYTTVWTTRGTNSSTRTEPTVRGTQPPSNRNR